MKHSESVHQKKTSRLNPLYKSVREKDGKIWDSAIKRWINPDTKGMKRYPGFCDLCAKMSNNIEWHMYYNHNTDPVECNDCKKMFKNKEILKKHAEIHILTPCSICGKMVKKPKMFYHMRSYHTSNEDKPFKCDVCGKGFVTKNSRDEHINIHTGDKPFKCKYCPSAFASRGTHAMHEKGHLGIKRKPKKL